MELIAAYGFIPSRIIPDYDGQAGLIYSGEGICPFVSAFLESALREKDVAGIVMTTACDQMRRGIELLQGKTLIPLFLLNVPTTWQSESSVEMYKSELGRLGKFLVAQGGREPKKNEMVSTIAEYGASREYLRSMRSQMSPRQYSEVIADFNRSGKVHVPKSEPDKANLIPIGILGGPLISTLFKIFKVVEDSGGRVALDATETGERGLPAPFDASLLEQSPIRTLVESYFLSIPDAFRRPDIMLYEWLDKMILERSLRGLILFRYTWCDTWYGEVQRLKEWSPVPVLMIDADQEGSLEGRVTTRIQAFMEMVRED
jgi:benzoyl-CoA reductase/2-hydroxyglutaryl-CoA dehydratase subunit BcrC/BadD/HgdB